MKYVLQLFPLTFLLSNILIVNSAHSDESEGWVVNNSVSLIADKADSFIVPMAAAVGGGGFGPYPGGGFGRGGGGSPLPVITLMLKHAYVKPDLQQSSGNQSSSQQGSEQRRQAGRSVFGQSRSGDELPPDDYMDLEKQPQEFESLLAELEKEMGKLVGEVVLLTGLYGTLLPVDRYQREQTTQLRDMFKAFVKKWRNRGKLRLIVVTDTILGCDQWRGFSDHQLPEPDYLISVGSSTEVFYGRANVMARSGTGFFSALVPRFSLFPDNLIPRSDGFYFDRYLTFIADLEDELAARLASEGVFITDVEKPELAPIYTFKVIPEMDLSQEENRERLKQGILKLFGVLPMLQLKSGTQEVRLSLPMTKGEWMSRLARAMGVSQSTIIAVGETEFDEDLLAPGKSSHFSVHTAVVVGNADRDFKEKMKGRHGVVMSTFSGILGVAQGFLSGLRKIVINQGAKAAEV